MPSRATIASGAGTSKGRGGESPTLLRPVSRGLFRTLLLVYVPLRLYLATLPGYAPDVAQYKRWAAGVVAGGLSSAYETTGVDYPPLFLYLLWPLAKIYAVVGPRDAAGGLQDSMLWTGLIKTPHLVFDVGLAALLCGLVGTAGLWGPARADPGWGRLAALLYLWNPAVLFGSAYWGQPDGIHSVLALAALACLGADRMLGAGVLLAAAGMMKPLAAPLVPLLAAVAALRRGVRGLTVVGLGALGMVLATLLPFLVSGRGLAVMRQLVVDLNAMPFTSVNAHNVWWIVGPWQPATGVLQAIGFGLFVTVDGLLLWRSRRWLAAGHDVAAQCAGIMLLGAAAVACFFLLSTSMHENHLFLAIPLLLAVAGRRRALGWLALGCSLAVFLNMFLHDPHLPTRLPGVLGWRSPVRDPALHRPYTWLQLVGSYVDTVLVATVAGGTYLAAWRGAREQSP